ncbi:XrtB/PEP-CTERM-associated polysaccharide biosynthesis outer membrane protein EpsL [Pseudorhodoferax sp.]|uniref:XrtB/PEP-CTERM-associated polysaccharide biosynthesis outer membrane protein EpsL n=1 Tax=Pseudorhodoferax sp. TaxID=1993553 RepID=UPI002DD6468F|nr:XrtB/PEP-CTERM-associated polysaccharide biosynthesis outer membrane protein EpsL [Pseudorhodoferax sp.]
MTRLGHPRAQAIALALAALLLAGPAAGAADRQGLRVDASQQLRYDSNLFRRSTDERSETLSTSTLGLALDKAYALQRVALATSVVAQRYRSNEQLNFNAWNYSAAWSWSLTPQLRGLLARTQTQDINNFDYYRATDRNVRTERSTRADAELDIGPAWRLQAGLERRGRDNERPTAQQSDYALDNLAAGLQRRFPSGSSIGWRMLDGRGDYSKREPGVSAAPARFAQREHEIRLVWPVTAATTLEARWAHLRRTHPGLPVRDYAGNVGQLSARWSATAKLGLQLTLARDLADYQTDDASYAVGERFALSPYWNLSARTTLVASHSRSRQDFRGALPGAADTPRQDRLQSTVLGLRWRPIDALSLGASLTHERRQSNTEGFAYTNHAARIEAAFSF